MVLKLFFEFFEKGKSDDTKSWTQKMKPFRLGTETEVLRRFYTNEWNEGANVIEFDLIALKNQNVLQTMNVWTKGQFVSERIG